MMYAVKVNGRYAGLCDDMFQAIKAKKYLLLYGALDVQIVYLGTN